MKHNLIFSIILLLSMTAVAQKQVEIKLNLRDGNSISGTTTMNDVTLKTAYGQLSIPVQNLSTIVIGIGKDKNVSDKALSYLKILNSNGSDDIKKGAYDDLIKLGPKAITAITEFQSDIKNTIEPDVTGDYTMDQALAELKSTYNIDDEMKINDVLTIDNEYTIGGTYDFNKMDVKTEYGNLSIPKEKINTMEIAYLQPNSGNEIVLKLLANKHISGNQNGGWLKTGITLKTGQKFSVTASGQITMASLSNQKYTPDGAAASSGDLYPPVVEGSTEQTATSYDTYPTYGNVVYKVGDNEYDIFKIGSKFSGTAKTNGMLFLSIYETVYNAANSGSYTVRIKLK